ncbi:SDR family oxidoreductase [Pseudonocardia kujensis]|uniref:SDR family NAD(P)-dependent oxidoreductase n=1 Tax=Pseudonocardia kujensis TaxID=1128675 RepID=UPI001E602A95|nr:SDR family oxidoreductase [Pseudonocardia kujensis]MCE0767911.1 SDR family oxidoreductase [Pseudonocardia kujensis]
MAPSPTAHPGAPARPVALVTGASRGLGYLIARELADRGHDLLLCARDGDGLQPARADLEARGARVVTLAADVGRPEATRELLGTTEREFGRLDVLVANAGIIQVGPQADLREEDYAQAMDVMFWGLARPALEAMPLLARSGGRILAVTSIGGKLPAPHLLPYGAAKHAAVGFAEGLRLEAGRQGVSVTVGVPGLMRTGSSRNALVTGNAQAERSWFTLGASLPLVSMDAERAARRLVRATLRGTPEIILTPLANIGSRVHALAPSTTLRLLTAVERLLPGPTGAAGPPRPAHTAPLPRWLRRLTGLDAAAAERWHEHTDPAPDPAGGVGPRRTGTPGR